MNTPMIIWTVIVAVIFATLVWRLMHLATERHSRHAHRHATVKAYHPHHAPKVELGGEWEEIFVPGDQIIHSDQDYDSDRDDI